MSFTRHIGSAIVASAALMALAGCADATTADVVEQVATPDSTPESAPKTSAPTPTVPATTTSAMPTGHDLCNALTPQDIDAILAWADFSIDPSKTVATDGQQSTCYFDPTEIDFSADVLNLQLVAYPRGYNFGHQPDEYVDRSDLPALWLQGGQSYDAITIAGAQVYVVDGYTATAILPEYTLMLVVFGYSDLPELPESVEALTEVAITRLLDR